MTRRAGAPQARLELPVTREGARRRAAPRRIARLAPFADRAADVQVIGLPAAAGAQLGAMLRPIATPLVMSGFEPESADLLAGDVPRRRLHAGPRRRARRTGRRRAPDDAGRCAKGTRSASRSSAATSRWARPARSRTSTAIASTRSAIPFFNLGPAQFPMTRAYVHTMLPSLMSSFKISTHGRGDRDDAAGSRDGDRRHARQGPSGDPDDRHAPLDARGRRARRRARSRTRSSTTSCSRRSSPTSRSFNTLGAYERQFGAATFSRQEPRPASRGTAT